MYLKTSYRSSDFSAIVFLHVSLWKIVRSSSSVEAKLDCTGSVSMHWLHSQEFFSKSTKRLSNTFLVHLKRFLLASGEFPLSLLLLRRLIDEIESVFKSVNKKYF